MNCKKQNLSFLLIICMQPLFLKSSFDQCMQYLRNKSEKIQRNVIYRDAICDNPNHFQRFLIYALLNDWMTFCIKEHPEYNNYQKEKQIEIALDFAQRQNEMMLHTKKFLKKEETTLK